MPLFAGKPRRDIAATAQKILATPSLIVIPKAPIYQALTDLPPFRPVAVSLMQMVGREAAGSREIARLIEADPALAAEVLALANSPLFGLSANVTSLTHAVTVLGLERVKALSTVIAIRIMLDGAPKTNTLRRCWRHSIACALIARELAPAYQVHREQAYTAGILHDVGRFGLMATHPEKYGSLCCTMHETPGDILDMESAWFQATHCQAGQFLVASWRLPEFFKGAVAFHHRRSTGPGVVPLIQAACLMADALGMDAIRYKLPKPEAVMSLLPDEARQEFSQKLASIEQAIVDSIKVFDF